MEWRCQAHGNVVADDRPFAPDSADCFQCWPEVPGKRERLGGGVASSPPLPCAHEGEELTGAEREARGLDHRRKWLHCLHPDKPIGPAVCKCRGCGPGCAGYQAPAGAVSFHLSAHGIGDAVCGVYVACGLAAAGHPVVFHTRQAAWLAGVSHPGVSVVQTHQGAGVDANADYGGQLRAGAYGMCASRAQWYADRVSQAAGVGPFATARPQVVTRPAPVLATGYTLVAPFSHGRGREWPVHKWVELCRRVEGRVVVVGTRADHDKLGAFSGLPARVSWHWGQSPAWVVAAVANAAHVYGNDSGIPHLAGLHGVPCTAVVAHLPGPFLFRESPSVSAVSPDWGCSPCGWQRDRGYQSRKCAGACPALGALGSERIPLPTV